MNKKIIIASLACMALMLLSCLCVYGATNFVEYENFEKCTDALPTGWRGQGYSQVVEIAETERGKSIVFECPKGKMEEVLIDKTACSPALKSVAICFGLRLEDYDGNRAVYMRCAAAEYALFQINTEGKIVIGGVETGGMNIEKGKWYDFFVEYNMKTGFLRIHVFDGEKSEIKTGEIAQKNLSGIYRLDFLTVGGRAMFDDVFMCFTDYEIMPYDSEGFAVTGFELPFGRLDTKTTKVQFTLNKPGVCDNAEFLLDNDASAFKSVSAEENRVTAEAYEPIMGERYALFEAKGIEDSEGNKTNALMAYIVQKELDVKEFTVTDNTLSDGKITSRVKLLSNNEELKSLLFITALYKKSTGEMVAAAFTKEELSAEVSEVSSDIDFAALKTDDNESYEAVSYLLNDAWQSLYQPVSVTIPAK